MSDKICITHDHQAGAIHIALDILGGLSLWAVSSMLFFIVIAILSVIVVKVCAMGER